VQSIAAQRRPLGLRQPCEPSDTSERLDNRSIDRRQCLPHDAEATGRHIGQLVKELLRDLIERLRIEDSDTFRKRAERGTPNAKVRSHLVERAGIFSPRRLSPMGMKNQRRISEQY
jgi:hypothetical protein